MPKLGGGGAERVVSTILRHIDKSKFNVHLILVHNKGDYLKGLPREVNITVLPSSKVRYAATALVKEIRRIRPDIVFSSIRGTSILISLIKPFLPKGTQLFFRENNTPSVSIKESRFPFIWKILYKTLFKNADKIICQSKHMVDDFKKNFGFNTKKMICIYNPVDIDMIEKESNAQPSPFQTSEYKNVVVVSKMMPQKGIDLLITSFAEKKEKVSRIKLWILGEGKYFYSYHQLSKMLEIDDQVIFVGRQENPFVWMKNADLLLLPSRYEGLPNVVLEAMACGCKVMTTNHPGGTREVMELTGNIENIVDELTWEPTWFIEDSTNSTDKLRKYFSVEKIIKDYEEIFS